MKALVETKENIQAIRSELKKASWVKRKPKKRQSLTEQLRLWDVGLAIKAMYKSLKPLYHPEHGELTSDQDVSDPFDLLDEVEHCIDKRLNFINELEKVMGKFNDTVHEIHIDSKGEFKDKEVLTLDITTKALNYIRGGD